ncbi:hypothetical protein Hanom_Chr17g01583501 [Helianthus anomalus]
MNLFAVSLILKCTTAVTICPVTHPLVGTTVKLPVKPVWLKDPTQVSLGLLSLPTSASLCNKCESNLHLSREIQVLHHLI